jgi:hypothetical protein
VPLNGWIVVEAAVDRQRIVEVRQLIESEAEAALGRVAQIIEAAPEITGSNEAEAMSYGTPENKISLGRERPVCSSPRNSGRTFSLRGRCRVQKRSTPLRGIDRPKRSHRTLGDGYFRFAFRFFIQRRADADDHRAKRNEDSADDDAWAANVMAERDVACDITPALSTELGQHDEIEHKKTSGERGGHTTEPIAGTVLANVILRAEKNARRFAIDGRHRNKLKDKCAHRGSFLRSPVSSPLWRSTTVSCGNTFCKPSHDGGSYVLSVRTSRRRSRSGLR